MSATDLIHYNQARTELATCARVDEAKAIKDKAEQLAAYARMRDDQEMEAWVRDIQIRATERIGELSRDLDKAIPHGRGPVSLPSDGKRKIDVLADAGISTSTAHRAEELAGGPTKNGQKAAVFALEGYLGNARKTGVVPNIREARAAVREAVRAAVPETKPRAKSPKIDPNYNAWLRWVSAIKDVAELEEATFAQMVTVAQRVKALPDNLKEAKTAQRRLARWITSMEVAND